MTTRFVIDIEATSFLGYLIRPPAEWREPLNGDWDPNAAEIHGITIDDLMRDGLPPHDVVERFEKAIGERAILYSDAPAFDGSGLEKLRFWGMARASRQERLCRAHLKYNDCWKRITQFKILLFFLFSIDSSVESCYRLSDLTINDPDMILYDTDILVALSYDYIDCLSAHGYNYNFSSIPCGVTDQSFNNPIARGYFDTNYRATNLLVQSYQDSLTGGQYSISI